MQFAPSLERIPGCLRPASERQHAIIRSLAGVEAWSLVTTGLPEEIADQIIRGPNAADSTEEYAELPEPLEVPDLMRSFDSVPYSMEWRVPGLNVHFETNAAGLLPSGAAQSLRSSRRPEWHCTALLDDAVESFPISKLQFEHLTLQVQAGDFVALTDRRTKRLLVYINPAFAERGRALEKILAKVV